jgi:putative membrane protein
MIDRSTSHPPTADDMARLRTILAANRTLMAWIRTALSMISFGFTIYKFLQGLFESGNSALVSRPEGPKHFGLSLMFLGVGALAIACVQYWREMKRYEPGRTPFSLPLVVAGFVALLGVLALMNVLFHVGPF